MLDEPLAGLDPAGRIELRKVLGMLRDQGCAMLVSSHILADLEEVATHIAIIERGSLLQWKTVEQMAHHHEERRKYEVGLLAGSTRCMDLLKTIDGVDAVTATNNGCTFEYTGEREPVAKILRRLIDDGIEIISFGVMKSSLEEAYLRAGIGQVD